MKSLGETSVDSRCVCVYVCVCVFARGRGRVVLANEEAVLDIFDCYCVSLFESFTMLSTVCVCGGGGVVE